MDWSAWGRGNVVETECGLDCLGSWKCGGDCMWAGLLGVVEMWWRLHVGWTAWGRGNVVETACGLSHQCHMHMVGTAHDLIL